MGIHPKTILSVLPLIITPLIFTGAISALSARNGITAIATTFLQFKAEEVVNYADGQWDLLTSNQLQDNESFIYAAELAVQSFAASVIRNDSELIFALDEDGDVAIASRDIEIDTSERQLLASLIEEQGDGWHEFELDGTMRVAQALPVDAFGWHLFVTEERRVFYESITSIIVRVVTILSVSLIVAVALLIVFAGYLTRPLKNVVTAMNTIITTNDLSRRVDVLYKDETGQLGHTFNIMVSELQKAYEHIKGYALRAVVAQTKEQKVRNIFQKYVPKDVIDQFFANPETLLVGEVRILSVLFSDIRGFTNISEQMRPDEVVECLNRYFTIMVDIIMKRKGIVDKYMGDGIMAFFGAPVRHQDDAYQSTLAGLEMAESLGEFNRVQVEQNMPEFRIGVGINYGNVTVGNIGSERKMDYTVIGDMVNLASRLEGLTKRYGEPLVISESVHRKVKDKLACRLLDRVVVKGRTMGVGVYSVRRDLTATEEQAWKLHHSAMDLYYERQFEEAQTRFQKVIELIPDDLCARELIERCQAYRSSLPPDTWNGVLQMTEK